MTPGGSGAAVATAVFATRSPPFRGVGGLPQIAFSTPSPSHLSPSPRPHPACLLLRLQASGWGAKPRTLPVHHEQKNPPGFHSHLKKKNNIHKTRQYESPKRKRGEHPCFSHRHCALSSPGVQADDFEARSMEVHGSDVRTSGTSTEAWGSLLSVDMSRRFCEQNAGHWHFFPSVTPCRS